MPEYDYHPKDRAYMARHGLKWLCYYTSKIASCHRAGYHCWVDAICGIYKSTGSMRLTAEALGVTQQCIGRHLHRLTDELEAIGATIKPQGGTNHTGAEKVEGNACRKCHTTQKYKTTHQCVECMRRYNEKLYLRRVSCEK